MDVPEFLRRWEAMPEPRPRAELLEGTVWLSMAAVRHDHHGGPHLHLAGWLSAYVWATPGVQGGLQSSVRLGLRNLPEPDGLLYVPRSLGGRARLRRDGYLDGAPELVVEVSGSTVAKDTGVKRRIYLEHGVDEYIIWRTEQSELEWLIRRGGDFGRLSPAADGLCKSEAMPGLWLDRDALLRGDGARLSAVSRAGLESAEHAVFVKKLKRAGRRPSRRT
jgi:Uma2 family endonuclease